MWRTLTLVVAGAACYAPRVPSGVPCGEDGACPIGQTCFDGVCATTAPAPMPDADVSEPDADEEPADAPIDAPPPIDTPPVPPNLSLGDRPGAIAGTVFDTFLDAGETGNNFGNHADLHLVALDREPILMRFDVSVVPSYATVTAAQLRLWVTAEAIDDPVTVHVYELNQSWTEGTGDHSAGIANYTERNAGMTWATSGARPPARAATPALAATVGPVAVGDELRLDLPPALIQAWMAAPANNHGVAILVSSTTSFYAELGSCEHGAQSRRPRLDLALE